MNQIGPQRQLLAASGFIWFFLMGCFVTMSGPAGIALIRKFALPLESAPQVATSFFIGSMGVIFASAAFSRLFAGVWVPRVCAALYFAGALIASLSTQWNALLLGVGMIGAANGGLSIWFNAEVAKQFDGPKVGMWLTIVNGFWAVGAICGPYLLSQFSQTPQVPFWFLCGSAGIGLLMTFGLRQTDQMESESHDQTSKLPCRVFGLSLLLGMYVGTESSCIVWMTQHLISAHGMKLESAAQIGSMVWLAFAVGRFGSGKMLQRLGAPIFVATCMAVACGGLLLTMSSTTVVAGYILLGLAMGPTFPSVILWGTSLTTQTHKATSIMVIGAAIAAAVFPNLVGSIVANQMSQLPIVLIVGFGLIVALATAWRKDFVRA